MPAPPTRNWGARVQKCTTAGKVPGRTGLTAEAFPRLSPATARPGRGHGASRARALEPPAPHTAQPSRSTYCRKGPSREKPPPPRLPGAKESTWRLPAAVRLPRTSCSLCNCAQVPSRPVASAGTGSSNIGRTRSMSSALRLPPAAPLPGHFAAAIFSLAIFLVT